jgi:hypothetical protein
MISEEGVPSALDPTSFVHAQHHKPAVTVERTEPQPSLVTFIETAEVKPVTTASLQIKEAEVASTIKVRVNKPFRVCHEGAVYTEGQQVTVPEHVAVHWERFAWVERVKTRTTKQEK